MTELVFAPQLTPKTMLSMGVFGGGYFDEDHPPDDLPPDWFADAQLSTNGFDPSCNYFGVAAGQSRAVWLEKGWITPEDPLGWFQWYCRYTLGRRLVNVDAYQIKRWKAFGARHVPQVKKNCEPSDVFCRPRQRQALLQWAYDPLI
ncbi:hypothetical protein [Magnetovibrio blakemorei]|uniref:Uncharacterized protein n=1 Tax=Magnetovibrio blakemorei TaxID=28181 RepID=A0A1E5Q6G4_9PROT|nr:hypothetical protein [Magnetovibrio blakemorei]OEJ66203.1 hypothetical protein BEN30_12475 [Magnetovibrio blakemorei]